MKKIYFLAITLLFSMFGFSQEIEQEEVALAPISVEVPKIVFDKFSNKFSDASKVFWAKLNGDFTATFEKNDKINVAVFSAKGQFFSSGFEIKLNELPKSMNDFVSETFLGQKVVAAFELKNANGGKGYLARTDKNNDVFFDENSKFERATNQ